MTEKVHLSMGEDSMKAASWSFLSPVIIYHFYNLGQRPYGPCLFLSFLNIKYLKLPQFLHFLNFLTLKSILLDPVSNVLMMRKQLVAKLSSNPM